MMYKMPCSTPTSLATAGWPAICSGMPTKHSTISTTPVMYAITRYRSTAALTASSSLASPSVPPAVVLDLGVEPGQVSVVGAEFGVLVLLGRAGAGLDSPDGHREVVQA